MLVLLWLGLRRASRQTVAAWIVAELRGIFAKPTVQKNSRYYFSICSLSGTTGKRKPPVRKTVLPTKVGSFARGKPISVSADSVRKERQHLPVEETYQAGSEKY